MFTIDLGKTQVVFKNRKKFQSSSTLDFLEQSKMLYNMDKRIAVREKYGKLK